MCACLCERMESRRRNAGGDVCCPYVMREPNYDDERERVRERKIESERKKERERERERERKEKKRVKDEKRMITKRERELMLRRER